MDRLIALVLLRWRLELRAVLGSRSRVLGLVLALPALVFLSLAAALAAYALLGSLERSRPELVLPVLSAGAVVFGLSWALSPLFSGVAATETHDFGRLMHYPVPLPSMLASSLLANLLQPLVLAQLPPLVALALALAAPGPGALAAVLGLLSSLALCLAVGQAVALVTQALSRHRRWHDRLLLVSLGLGFGVSLLPLLVLSGGRELGRALLALLERDVFVLLPFSWGARAAVHAARGELLPSAAWLAGALLAVVAVLGTSAALAQRLYRGELDLGEASGGRARRSRGVLPGIVGALVEKDLLVTWRDPRLKALVFTSVIGPTLVLLALWQGAAGRASEGLLLGVAGFAGLGVLGSNSLGLERQGLALLFSFPVDRFSVLVAKTLVSMVLRLPALLLVVVATLVAAGAWMVPAAATVLLVTQLVAAGVDAILSVLAPLPVAAPGRDPNSATSGGRGLGAAALAMAAMLIALLLSLPFAFLAWLPRPLGVPALWLLALPLALAGAAAVYFMLASWAATLLARREPELVAQASGEA